MQQAKNNMAENKFLESNDIFHINFGGENEIDVQTFATVMQDIIEISRKITTSIDPNAIVRLNIYATGRGSFDAILNVIVSYIPNLINAENLTIAKTLTGGLVDVFNIKKFLKGEKPKNIETNNERQIITNHKDEKLDIPKEIGNIYFQDTKIDNITVNIFNVLNNDNTRSDFKIITSERTLSIDRNEYSAMAKNVVNTRQEVVISNKEIVTVNLRLKKPDLLGDSKWEFIFNKKISVKIEDKTFLDMVHKGKIKNLYAGVKIHCELAIEYQFDDKYEIIPSTETYTILRVIGDIIEPIEDNNLFE